MILCRFRLGVISNTRTYATSTIPKPQAHTQTTDSQNRQSNQSPPPPNESSPRPLKREFAPVYVAVGMITLAVALGLHTMKQQLFHSPDVRVKKTERGTVPEVEKPEKVAEKAEGYQKNSLFRKVAHVQDNEYGDHPVRDDIRKDAYAYKPRAETLKDAGVDAAKQG